MEDEEAATAAAMMVDAADDDAAATVTVKFRAGKMTLSDSRVTADPRKGWIQVGMS